MCNINEEQNNSPVDLTGHINPPKEISTISGVRELCQKLNISEEEHKEQIFKFLDENPGTAEVIQKITDQLTEKAGRDYAASFLKEITSMSPVASTVESNNESLDKYVRSFVNLYTNKYQDSSPVYHVEVFSPFSYYLEKDLLFQFISSNPTINVDGIVSRCCSCRDTYIDLALCLIENLNRISKSDLQHKEPLIKHLVDLFIPHEKDPISGLTFNRETSRVPIVTNDLPEDYRIALQALAPFIYEHDWMGCYVIYEILSAGKCSIREDDKKYLNCLPFKIPDDGIITLDLLREEDKKTYRPEISILTKKICEVFQDKEKIKIFLNYLDDRVACHEFTQDEGLEILKTIANNTNNDDLPHSLICRNKLNKFNSTDAVIDHSLSTLSINEHTQAFLKYTAMKNTDNGVTTYTPDQYIKIGNINITGDDLNKIEKTLNLMADSPVSCVHCVSLLSEMIIAASKSGNRDIFQTVINFLDRNINKDGPDFFPLIPYLIQDISNGKFDNVVTDKAGEIQDCITEIRNSVINHLGKQQIDKLRVIFNRDLESEKDIPDNVLYYLKTIIDHFQDKADPLLERIYSHDKGISHYNEFVCSLLHIIAYPREIEQSGPTCVATALLYDLADNTPEGLYDITLEYFLENPDMKYTAQGLADIFQEKITKKLKDTDTVESITNLNSVTKKYGIEYEVISEVPPELKLTRLNEALELGKSVLFGYVKDRVSSCGHAAKMIGFVKKENGEIAGYRFIHGHGMEAFNGTSDYISKDNLLLSITNVSIRKK